MQQQHKFVRKKENTIVEQELKKEYEPLLRTLFRILGLQRSKEDKIAMIQKEYQAVSNRDVERNPIFISSLVDLKNGLEAKRPANPKVWENFRDGMKLLKIAEIIDQPTFQELCGEIQEGLEEGPALQDELAKRMREEANRFLLNLIRKKESSELRKELDICCEAIIEDLKKEIDFQQLDSGLTAEFWQMGSATNGFALADSDYDVTISTNNMECVDERAILNFFYRKAKKILANQFTQDDFKIEIQAHEKIRIPIVNLRIYVKPQIDISFTVNNELGVYNSHLLKIYSEFDQRCHDLGLLVKIWAQTQEVISAKKNFLSSYAFMLMVINFLQTLKDPILPTLQSISQRTTEMKIIRKVNNGKIDTFNAKINYESNPEILKTIKSKYSSNKQTNIDLLRKFFKFYSQEHKFNNIKLSIKKASHLPRPEKEMELLYSIEDPFDLFHNPGKPLKKNSVQAEKLLKVMRKSYELLKQNKTREVFEGISKNQH